MSADPMLRASDDDREAAVAALTKQVGTGRLALPEFDQRAAAAYAAETVGDLQALVGDLPIAAESTPDDDPRAAWFRWAGVGAITLVIWIATSMAAGQLLYFWPAWVIGPWGAAMLLSHLAGRREACS